MASALPHNLIADLAIEHGAVVRLRKVDIVSLVYTLIIGVPVGQRRSLAALRRAFELATGTELVPSSFFERFTPQLAKVLKAICNHLIDTLKVAKGHALTCAIKSVCDVLATDATVFADKKLHAVTNVTGTSANRLKVTDKTTHDSQVWKRIGKWIRGHLLLVDLGYYDFHLFWRIDKQGGFVLSRAKTNFNPVIVGLNKRHRGKAVKVVGEKLQDVLERFERKVFDFQVRVEVTKRRYRGVRRKVSFEMRLVGIWNAEAGRYHLYLTNLGPDELDAKQVGEIYRLRWQVELLWASMKGEGRLAQIPSKKKAVKEVLMFSSIAFVLMGKVLLEWLRRHRHGPVWLNTRLLERVWDSIRNVVFAQLMAQRRDDDQSGDPLLRFVLHELATCSQTPSTPFLTAFIH